MSGAYSEATVQRYARVGGVLYLFVIVAALFAEVFVRGSLIVPQDPGATASKLLASETLFRLGLAGEMLCCVCDLALAMILYFLLRPVSRNLALLAAFLRLAFVAVYSVALLFEFGALVALGGAGQLRALDAGQLQSLAYLALKMHSVGYGASLLFFGFSCAVLGHLIRDSGYLPRMLGSLLFVGGSGYVLYALGLTLAPAVASAYLFPWIMLPAFVAELGLALWLAAKGVDVPRWKEAAQA